MWDFGTLPYLDFSYLNTPEFQKAVQEAAAQAAVPVAAPAAAAPVIITPQAAPIAVPQYTAPVQIPQYVEPVVAPQAVAPVQIPQYIDPFTVSQPVAPVDFSYLNTPEFQKAVQEAVATYTGVPVETAAPVAAPQYVEPVVQYAAPIVAPDYVEPVAAPQPTIPAEIAQYIEPMVAPQVAAPVAAPVVMPQAVAAEPAAFVPSVLDTAGAALGNSPTFDAQALLDAGLSQADVNALANWSPSMISSDIIQPGGLGPAAIDQSTYGFETLTAPLSNKGNPTATYGNISNTIAVGPEQAVRLVDAGGNVVFSGTGIEGATKAVEMAQGISDQLGNKAAWEIQTGPSGIPGTSTEPWNTIAQENKNASVLGQIADVALPVLGGMINPILGAAMGSALSSAAQGRGIGDTLLRAAIAGGTSALGAELSGGLGGGASAAGGSAAGSQVGSEIASNLASNIAQGAADEIIVNAIINSGLSPVATSLLSSVAGSALGSALSPAAQGPQAPVAEPPSDIIVTAQQPASGIGAIDLAPIVTQPIAQALPEVVAPPTAIEPPPAPQPEEIVVTAQPPAAGIGAIDLAPIITQPIAQALPEVVNTPAAIEQLPVQQPEEIIVTAQQPTAGIGAADLVSVLAPPAVAAALPEVITPSAPVEQAPAPQPDEIIVTAQEPAAVINAGDLAVAGIGGIIPGSVTGGGTNPVTGEQNDITVTADNQVQGLTPPVLPNVGPLDVSTDITNTVKDVQVPSTKPPMTTADYIKAILNGVGLLSEVFGGGGGGGATLGPDGTAISYNPLNRQQRLRTPVGAGLGSYGFNPFTYGQASGDQPGEYLFFEPTPVAAPVTPAFTVPSGALQFAEGGDVDDDMVKHLIEYRKGGGHNGPGKVKGIGSGQEDKIPAWLSDGEYVWSAQDVADLGDGSTDEGVRRLDKMRQMVRHRAGRKDVKKIAKPQKGIDALLAAVGGK